MRTTLRIRFPGCSCSNNLESIRHRSGRFSLRRSPDPKRRRPRVRAARIVASRDCAPGQVLECTPRTGGRRGAPSQCCGSSTCERDARPESRCRCTLVATTTTVRKIDRLRTIDPRRDYVRIRRQDRRVTGHDPLVVELMRHPYGRSPRSVNFLTDEVPEGRSRRSFQLGLNASTALAGGFASTPMSTLEW
jgi:hypothetical protein